MAESMSGLARSHRCTEVSNKLIGTEVTVMGWVQKRRNLGSLIFVDLRDRSGILQLVFDQEVLSEVHEAKGRADLIVNTDIRRIVFEFKYAQNETEAKAKLSEAIEQIKSRDYGNIVPRKNELLRIAAVFNADPKVRAFTQYKFVQ